MVRYGSGDEKIALNKNLRHILHILFAVLLH